MCGIAGILYADPTRPVEAATLQKMGDAIAHRGPDGAGFFRDPGIGLAHRRLSIIDLSGGAQPMANEDGSLQVVFNGEIYNYPVLRQQLLSRGHILRTHSDTEVLVHLYEDYGDDLVNHLRGMFAFALWDRRRRRLLLARDRVGQKPLYVYRDREKLLFGSELKAILAHGDVDRTVDEAAVEDYLCFGMVPGNRSIFRRIHKLPAAQVWGIEAPRFDTAPRRYWRFEPRPDFDLSVAEWQEAIVAKVDETVQAHRLADVPLGAFLSGGVDSSVVVETLTRLGATSLQTFAIGFREAAFDESPYAREVAEHFGCRHEMEIVTPEAIESLADLVRYYDEPFADISAIPTLHLARLARRQVKVALSGDGGDEAFGGYSRYAHDLAEDRWRRRIPEVIRTQVLGRLARVWPKADWLPRPLRAKTRLTNLSLSPAAAYANTLSQCRLPLRRTLLQPDVVRALNGHQPEASVADHPVWRNGDPLAGMIAADVEVLLPDDFLTKVDRASMACGLEVRPPLVDHELLELAGRIPSPWKVQGSETKWIFKETYRPRLPQAVTMRPKQGFEIPIDDWLRGPLREMFQATVLESHGPLREWIVGSEVQRMFTAHLARTGRHGQLLFSLLVLARWTETYTRESPSNDSHNSPVAFATRN